MSKKCMPSKFRWTEMVFPQSAKTLRVKRETCEKGATWTDWIPTSSRPSCQSRLSCSIILRDRSPLGQDVQAIEVLPCRNGVSAAHFGLGNRCRYWLRALVSRRGLTISQRIVMNNEGWAPYE